MNDLIRFVSEHGLLLSCGSTWLLSAGALAVALTKSPAHRQRLAELTIASALAWILFLILLGLTILVFRASRSLVYYEGLKT